MINILGISGSLRKGAFSTRLLEIAREYLPADVTMTIVGCGDIPHYNQDLDGESKPEPVQRFRAAIQQSDGLVFSGPEYNHSIPGVLKNAMDWASRPKDRSPLAGKPTAIISSSISFVGGTRMQAHMHQVLISTLTPIYPAAEMLVGTANQKFDAAGRLTDADTQRRLRQYIEGFVQWILKVKRSGVAV